jgi:hypothetical protein
LPSAMWLIAFFLLPQISSHSLHRLQIHRLLLLSLKWRNSFKPINSIFLCLLARCWSRKGALTPNCRNTWTTRACLKYPFRQSSEPDH